jgi:hypothetical protein
MRRLINNVPYNRFECAKMDEYESLRDKGTLDLSNPDYNLSKF